MICYAIKNELGQYLGISTDRDYFHYWTDIEYCYLFRDVKNYPALQQAEDFRATNYPNCKVVKVEIKEIEDGKIN